MNMKFTPDIILTVKIKEPPKCLREMAAYDILIIFLSFDNFSWILALAT